MKNFIALPNICGTSNATKTTVALFNSCLHRKKDENGFYLLVAIKPHLNGVIVEKKYT